MKRLRPSSWNDGAAARQRRNMATADRLGRTAGLSVRFAPPKDREQQEGKRAAALLGTGEMMS